MNKIGKWTEQVKIISDNLKDSEVVTEDGELVRLHQDAINSLAMDIVDYAEKLNGTDSDSMEAKERQEIVNRIQNQDAMDKLIYEYLGNFYFNYYKRLETKLRPMNLVRFLYLCAYMDYQNRLVKRIGTKNIPIYEKDLQEILNLGKTEYYSAKKELIENELIIINEDKTVNINTHYCKKGKIVKNSVVSKMRMFNNGIRNLYESCKPKEHKKLSFLYEIIKYCHYDYNIICYNPTEELSDLIKPITVKELCSILEYKNVTRFRGKLLDFKINGKPVFDIHNINRKDAITINPEVYYAGNKIECLEGLLVLFGLCR